MYKRTVTHQGESFTYDLYPKRIKSYNMRVKGDGVIYVSAPYGASFESIDKFVTDRVDFIHSARKKIKERSKISPGFSNVSDGSVHSVFGAPHVLSVTEGNKSSVGIEDGKILITVRGAPDEARLARLLYAAMTERLYELACSICKSYLPLFPGIEYPEIKIRNMTSRWGSCHTRKHVLTFSSQLAGMPVGFIEYVVMHELCHFLYADHSGNFYRELSARMPDWKERKRGYYEN